MRHGYREITEKGKHSLFKTQLLKWVGEPEPAPNTARYTVTDRLQLIPLHALMTRMKSDPSAVWTTCHSKASGVTLWRSMSSIVVAGGHGVDLAGP
jgi:hypothetical protein